MDRNSIRDNFSADQYDLISDVFARNKNLLGDLDLPQAIGEIMYSSRMNEDPDVLMRLTDDSAELSDDDVGVRDRILNNSNQYANELLESLADIIATKHAGIHGGDSFDEYKASLINGIR